MQKPAGSPENRVRRGVAAILATGLFALLGGCSSDGVAAPAPTAERSDQVDDGPGLPSVVTVIQTTTVDPADPDQAAIIATVADYLANEEKTLQLTPTEADCLGAGYVQVVGMGTFDGVDPDDKEAVQEALFSMKEPEQYAEPLAVVFDGCGLVTKAAASVATSEATGRLSDEQELELVNCVAGKLDPATARLILEEVLITTSTNDPERAQAGRILADLGRDCGFKMRVYP